MTTPYHVPTIYHGVRYRSRLEARWAVFFEHADIPARYESAPVRLPSGVYLPDFWLPGERVYAEVKPSPHTPAALAKCAELARGRVSRVLLLVGPPDDRAYDMIDEIGRMRRAGWRWGDGAERAASLARGMRWAA